MKRLSPPLPTPLELDGSILLWAGWEGEYVVFTPRLSSWHGPGAELGTESRWHPEPQGYSLNLR